MPSTKAPAVLQDDRELFADQLDRIRELRLRDPEVLQIPGVRGMRVGRAALDPHDGDVARAIDQVAALERPT